MSSSIFGAEQRISEPLSALAVLTGRHREKNTRDPVLVNESTSQRGWPLKDPGSHIFGVRCCGARPSPGGRHSRVARRGARSWSWSHRARWDARRVGARARSSSRRVKSSTRVTRESCVRVKNVYCGTKVQIKNRLSRHLAWLPGNQKDQYLR